MSNLRGPGMAAAAGSTRSKVIGAAVIAFGLGVLGLYAFAGQEGPKPDNAQFDAISGEIMTTPEGAQPMPPPVTPTVEKVRRKPTPRPTRDAAAKTIQEAAVTAPIRMPPPPRTEQEVSMNDAAAPRQP